MIKRILILAGIFVCATFAWMILAGVVSTRTSQQDRKLRHSVGKLWGTPQTQLAPHLCYKTKKTVEENEIRNGHNVTIQKQRWTTHRLPISGSAVNVDIHLKHRKKGLLWYATYKVQFDGTYTIQNTTGEDRDIWFVYKFPSKKALYDNFRFQVDGKEIKEIEPTLQEISRPVFVKAGEIRHVTVRYNSQGLDQWWYKLGESVSRVRNFKLNLTTNFDDVNFPENSVSPTGKTKTSNGWQLEWKYRNLISDVQLGMDMPQKLNPGPFVAKVTFFAPISLFFFLFLMFIITTVRGIKIHPMNYFFIVSAFFSFHLLMSYLVDHISVRMAFTICSLVSIFLVISYMRLVVGLKFAFLEIGLSQLVFLVLFSYCFFFEGFTGLVITIALIITLFTVMQFTGRVNWEDV
ncbi:MAG: cell envelope integrity protein CreD [Acidobacteria bacterium]|nr:cell envelope integrity protein CreD [Acidobacteriota bacterium]